MFTFEEEAKERFRQLQEDINLHRLRGEDKASMKNQAQVHKSRMRRKA